MSRKSLLIGLISLMAACVGAWAGDDTRQVTEVALPHTAAADADQSVPLRPSEGIPRYATMTPPPPEEAPPAPLAAPTAKVSVVPVSEPQPASLSAPGSAVRSGAPDDHIAGLRPSEDSLYRLGPGDKLRLTVFNEGDLSGDFTVDGQGFVRLPLVGQVPAAGLTSFGLEARIGQAFVNGGFLLNPRISVEIVTYRPFYIIGEVAKPGEYAYVDAMTAPNAVALAGGYTDRAVETTIWIRHQGDSREHEFRADETTRIRPGDVVRVERSAYWTLMTLLSPLISPFATTAYLLK